MQVTITPDSPAQKRLVAALLNDMASLQAEEQELFFARIREMPKCGPAVQGVEEAQAQAEVEAAPKKSRAKKTEPAVTTAVTSSTEPEAETAAPAVANEVSTVAAATTEAAKTYSVDDLRKLFGDLAQADKRDAAVKIVRSYGFNSIAAITPDKLDEIGGQLEALLNG